MAANPGLFLLIFVLLFTIQLQMWNKFRLSKSNRLNVVLGIESVDTGLKNLFATLGDHLLAFSVQLNYKVIFNKWTISGLFFLYFRQLTVNMFIINFCRWLDSNCGPLDLEATVLLITKFYVKNVHTFWTGIRTGAFHAKVVHSITLEPSFVSVSEITFFVKKCSLSVLIFEISLKSNLGQTREASFIKFRRNYQNFLKSKKWFCPNNFFSQTFKDGKAWGVEGNETSAEGIEVQKQWCQHIST